MLHFCNRVALAVLLLFGAAAISARAEDPAAEPADQDAKKPRVLVTISKETTYITEPLRPDGYPDYVAALNLQCSEGVTPENNAAVLFWQAMGPGEIAPNIRPKYFQMLGIPPLPEEGDYFVNLDEYVKRQKAVQQPAAEQPEEEDDGRRVWERFCTAIDRPWSKEEFPEIAGWLEANEKPLALLVEASKRPRRYDPLIGENTMAILGPMLPTLQQHRNLARILCARAMLRLKAGKVDAAWDDLLTCHRFARLFGQGPTLVEALVAITIDGMACAKDQVLLQQAALTATQITKMRADLAELPPMPRMADRINLAERFFGLSYTLMMVRQEFCLTDGPKPRSKLDNLARRFIRAIGVAMIDGDLMLRMSNAWYDRIVDALRRPTHREKQATLRDINADLESQNAAMKDPKSLVLAVLANPRKAISEFVGQGVAALILPALSAAANAEDRALMQFDLTRLAFALAEYRAENGAYPASLADLAPKHLAEVPKDIFNDAELHYRQEGQGYLLYSVGRNGKDDGGKGSDDRKENTSVDWDDLGVRMPASN